MSKPATTSSTAFHKGEAASFLACAVVLAIGAFAPEHEWLRVARGDARIGREVGAMETRGYYEALIDANRDPAARADDAPPPDWVPFGASGIAEAVPTYLRWKMRPNLDVVWNGTSFRTNAQGYRTPEVATPKPTGVYRIVVLGSSNTMGHGVGEEESYFRLAEPWLNAATDPGVRVEIVNLSVSGDSPSRRLVRMIEEAPAYEPDWILCDASVLDPALEEMHLEAIVRAEPPVEIPSCLSYVREALDRQGLSASSKTEKIRAGLRREAGALLEGAFQGWAEFARRTETPLTMVVIPRADAKLDNPAIAELMTSAISRNGLDALDLSAAFQSLSAEEFRVSPWDKHPSVRGHQALFHALRSAIQERGALPGLDLAG